VAAGVPVAELHYVESCDRRGHTMFTDHKRWRGALLESKLSCKHWFMTLAHEFPSVGLGALVCETMKTKGVTWRFIGAGRVV